MSSFADRFYRMTPKERQFALKHLARHLTAAALESLDRQSVRAHQMEDLHWLLTEREWMETHVANEGSYGPFLEEVQLAWQIAEKAGQQLEQARSEMIARQVHYALLQTSFNSLASNMPPELLMAGLRAGRWGGETALVYAQQMVHRITQVTMLIQVGSFLHEHGKEDQAREAFKSALAGIREIEKESDRVEAFVALAPHLPSELLADALGLVATPEIFGAEGRAKPLEALAPRLPVDLLHQAFEIIREMDVSDDQAAALTSLAPYLPQSLLSEALELVSQAYYWSSYRLNRAKLVAALAPHLPPALIPEAVVIAEAITTPFYRTAALMAFPHYGQPEQRLDMMRQALKAAQAAGNINDRTEGIVLLAPHLPPELLPEAVTIARTIGDKEPYDTAYRKQALVALAPHLPPALQAEVIAAVRTWWPVCFSGDVAAVLAALAPYLSQDLMPAALAIARETIRRAYSGDEQSRDYYRHVVDDFIPAALLALVPYLPRQLMPEALEAASEIQADNARSYALAAVAPHLPPELLPKALQIARQVQEPNWAGYRARALAALSQYGAPAALDEALTIAQQGEAEDDSVLTLPRLLVTGARLSPLEQRAAFLDEALKAAREIFNPRYRSEALTEVAASLPSESRQAVLDEALKAADEIQKPIDHALTLGRLIPYLPLKQRPRVLTQALKGIQKAFKNDVVDRTSARITLLSLLAPFLPPQQLKQALAEARATSNPALRGRSLAMIAPHLPPNQCSKVLNEALQAARKIKETDRFEEEFDRPDRSGIDLREAVRIGLKTLLRNRFPSWLRDRFALLLDAQRRTAAMEAVEVPDVRKRFEVLAQIAMQLPSDQRQTVLAEALEAAEKMQAIAIDDDVVLTLVKLAAYLSPELCTSALALARKMRSAHVLAALVPYVPPEEQQAVLDEALAAAQEMKKAGRQVSALALLLPQLPLDRRLEILQVALADMQLIAINVFVSWKLFSQGLWLLAVAWSQLPQQQAYALWGPTLHEYAKYRRTHFLAALIGLLPVMAAWDDALRERVLEVLPGEFAWEATEHAASLAAFPVTWEANPSKNEQGDGTAALTETLQTVVEICRRWPWPTAAARQGRAQEQPI